MSTQPTIIEELHAVREQLVAESGGTLAGLVARLQAEQKKSKREILKNPPKKAVPSAPCEPLNEQVEGVKP